MSHAVSRKTLAWAALALSVAIALSVGAIMSWRRPAPKPEQAEAVPWLYALTLPDADGVPRPLKTWQGKLLVVNFWATWCAPCIEEMPQLQKFSDEFEARNVAVIGIGVDEPDRIREFARQHGLRIALLAAGFDGMQLATRLGNPEPVLPYTALISPAGRLVEEHSGRLEPGELRRWVGRQGTM
ncbi:MAG: TlpA family protein disulfide reductase [Burkholderiaceae bacterium]|nr:TlpA family protein disulfide reductase [Burkholderiaceae bacterium]